MLQGNDHFDPSVEWTFFPWRNFETDFIWRKKPVCLFNQGLQYFKAVFRIRIRIRLDQYSFFYWKSGNTKQRQKCFYTHKFSFTQSMKKLQKRRFETWWSYFKDLKRHLSGFGSGSAVPNYSLKDNQHHEIQSYWRMNLLFLKEKGPRNRFSLGKTEPQFHVAPMSVWLLRGGMGEAGNPWFYVTSDIRFE